jgi:hypothetical protein
MRGLPQPELPNHTVGARLTRNKLWNCIFCQNKNQLPSGFVQFLNQGQIPNELQQNMTTVEYTLSEGPVADNIFVFLVDTSLPLRELKAIKESLIEVK